MSAKPAYEYNLKHWSDIQDHLPRLHDAARGNVLEIGVRSGVSTSALLAGIEEHGGHVYSVDINDCRVFAGHRQWSFFQLDTQKEPEFLRLLIRNNPVDVLFVDGDHSYEGALSDLEHFGPYAKRIFVHDTNAPDFPGVLRAVQMYCETAKRMAKFYAESYGMAEIV